MIAKALKRIKTDGLDVFEGLLSLVFPEPPDPKRFSPGKAPKGWHTIPPKVEKPLGNLITSFRPDESINVFHFTDKNFGSATIINPNLTDRDIEELVKRNLDPHNSGYTQAKRMYADNPQVSRLDLFEGIPSVSIHTFKDVLAAFRAALRSPTETGGGAETQNVRGNAREL